MVENLKYRDLFLRRFWKSILFPWINILNFFRMIHLNIFRYRQWRLHNFRFQQNRAKADNTEHTCYVLLYNLYKCQTDWLTWCTFFLENNSFLEMSHDILSLEVYYSFLVFVKEGKENHNTQYYRIAINLNRNTNRIDTHVSWKNRIGTKAYCSSHTYMT